MTVYYDACGCGRRKCATSKHCQKCRYRGRVLIDGPLADYARHRFAEGYGPRVIALEAHLKGMGVGVTYEGLVQRLVRWRHEEGIPLLRQRMGVRGQPVMHQDPGAYAARLAEEAERRAVEKAEREAAALRLRRADTPCAWCDCARPGRRCVECGRVAPRRQA